MNSEQIESRFGSYRVKVLQQDTNSRLASLCSEHDGDDIAAPSLSRFAPVPDSLVDADKLIREGHSIGSTLKQAGMSINDVIERHRALR